MKKKNRILLATLLCLISSASFGRRVYYHDYDPGLGHVGPRRAVYEREEPTTRTYTPTYGVETLTPNERDYAIRKKIPLKKEFVYSIKEGYREECQQKELEKTKQEDKQRKQKELDSLRIANHEALQRKRLAIMEKHGPFFSNDIFNAKLDIAATYKRDYEINLLYTKINLIRTFESKIKPLPKEDIFVYESNRNLIFDAYLLFYTLQNKGYPVLPSITREDIITQREENFLLYKFIKESYPNNTDNIEPKFVLENADKINEEFNKTQREFFTNYGKPMYKTCSKLTSINIEEGTPIQILNYYMNLVYLINLNKLYIHNAVKEYDKHIAEVEECKSILKSLSEKAWKIWERSKNNALMEEYRQKGRKSKSIADSLLGKIISLDKRIHLFETKYFLYKDKNSWKDFPELVSERELNYLIDDQNGVIEECRRNCRIYSFTQEDVSNVQIFKTSRRITREYKEIEDHIREIVR